MVYKRLGLERGGYTKQTSRTSNASTPATLLKATTKPVTTRRSIRFLMVTIIVIMIFVSIRGRFQVSQKWLDHNILHQTLLVIATVPRSRRHVIALWTELECLVQGKNMHVVVVAPPDKREIVEKVVHQFNNQNIETMYFVNDFYDVGLWCNALHAVGFHNNVTGGLKEENNTHKLPLYDSIILTNDSIFMLRRFTDIDLGAHDLVSLSYSNTRNRYWVESALRAFSINGLRIFMNHSCVPSTHDYRCQVQGRPVKSYQCLVRHHEVELASQFARDRVMGLYESDDVYKNNTWIHNPTYWKWLVETQGFPVAKVKPSTRQIIHEQDPWLANCTRQLDRAWLEQLDI